MSIIKYKYTIHVQDIGVIEHFESINTKYDVPTLSDRIRDNNKIPHEYIKIGNYVIKFKFIIGYKMDRIDDELDEIPIDHEYKVKSEKILSEYIKSFNLPNLLNY